MSNKEPREALGARDGETLLDAAKRVVRERDEAIAYAEAMIGGAQAMTAHNIAELERAKASPSIYEQSYGPKEKRARAKAFDDAIHIVKHGLGVEGEP
jgi:hypothetical protein